MEKIAGGDAAPLADSDLSHPSRHLSVARVSDSENTGNFESSLTFQRTGRAPKIQLSQKISMQSHRRFFSVLPARRYLMGLLVFVMAPTILSSASGIHLVVSFQG